MYDESDILTIHEVDRALQRKLKGKSRSDTMKLARYIVEPRDSEHIMVNELLEEKMDVIIEKLDALVPDYTIFTPEMEANIKKSLVKKFSTRMFSLIQTLESIETEPDIISYESVDQINKILKLQLASGEEDYIILIMYRSSNDIRKLPFQILIKELEALGCEVRQQEESKHIGDEVLAEAAQMKLSGKEKKVQGEEFSTPTRKSKPAKSNSEPNEKDLDDEGENPDSEEETQMIELAQNCFRQIAEKMQEKGVSVTSFFKKSIIRKSIANEETDIISTKNFLNGLKELGIADLGETEKKCLIKVLAINEEEGFIRVCDIIQILEDYGIAGTESGEDTTEGKSASQFLNFEELNDVSLVLLLALTEYLSQAQVPLYQLLGDAVYKQVIQTKTKRKTVDLINSADFFAVLTNIGVSIEEREYDNLRDFLCLDKNYRDKLYIKKIQKAIEEFYFNEDLKTYARKCYEEMIDQDPEDGENEE